MNCRNRCVDLLNNGSICAIRRDTSICGTFAIVQRAFGLKSSLTLSIRRSAMMSFLTNQSTVQNHQQAGLTGRKS